jgi:hypothetical protein
MSKNTFSLWTASVYQQSKSIPGFFLKRLMSIPQKTRVPPAANERRRLEKQEMVDLGIRSKKAYRKYRKAQRRLARNTKDEG